MRCLGTCQHKITFVLMLIKIDLTLVGIFTVTLDIGSDMSDQNVSRTS